MADFDATLYEPLPQTSADRLIPLLHALLRAGASIKDPTIKRGLRLVRENGEGFQQVFYAPKPEAVEKPDTKLVDNQVDTVIGIVSQRILDWTELGPKYAAQAAEAQTLQAKLFPDGLGILKLAYRKQWAHCHRMLKIIDEQDLEGAVVKFIGAPFLAYARDRVAEYGRVLGITEELEAAETAEPINDHMLATRRAIATYVRVAVGQVELSAVEPAVVQAALQPIAELRAEARAANSSPKKGKDESKNGEAKKDETKGEAKKDGEGNDETVKLPPSPSGVRVPLPPLDD
jgi:hypothetical protein